MLVINCKNYREANGKKLARLIKAARSVADRRGTQICIAPPGHLIGVAVGNGIPILAQHADDVEAGSTTGFMAPELLKDMGVRGSLINHSEHRTGPGHIRRMVERLDELGMKSILCVRDVRELKRYAGLEPDYIAIEPPELIGSGRAVSKERPDLISRAASAVRDAGGRTRLLCGAGIISGDDVARALELGSAGVLVASGIIKASGWTRTISEFAVAMPKQ